MFKKRFIPTVHAVLLLLTFAGSIFSGVVCAADDTSYDKSYVMQIETAALNLLEPQAATYAEQFNTSDYEVRIKPVNRKLNLPLCSAPVQIENLSRRPIGSQKLKASCTTPQSWKIYIQATITIRANVLVSNTTLTAGQSINISQITFQDMDISNLRRGFFTDISELRGKEAKRTIRPNTPLTPVLLKKAALIEKGDRISITSGVNGIVVQMPGEAMEEGVAGEQIRVKNISSNKIVYGRVRDKLSVITGQ